MAILYSMKIADLFVSRGKFPESRILQMKNSLPTD
jgi:hypothetical protein